MSTHTPSKTIYYPDSDGLPMAENTLQFRWITTIVGGLEALFREDPNVFVAGDLFWYPVEGDNRTRTAPDAMVAFGRPKGDRGSYMQWDEDGIPPQVVFEVLSPGNRFGEMARKLAFYERFGVEEYYLFNPEPVWLEGWLREGDTLHEISETNGWLSPRLGVCFELTDSEFRILGPDGRPFESYMDIVRRAEDERRRADDERRRAEDERRRADRMAEQLRSLGLDPDA
ncbi:MAG: Uma2 family endonuclease [Isosphaeraceae bacterium]|nr:Uma2 family endonuclease [Isosphaeraceae bacterium]